MDRHQPLVERDMRIREDRADRDAKLFAASGALVDALARVRFRAFLWLKFVRFADQSAVRANRVDID